MLFFKEHHSLQVYDNKYVAIILIYDNNIIFTVRINVNVRRSENITNIKYSLIAVCTENKSTLTIDNLCSFMGNIKPNWWH